MSGKPSPTTSDHAAEAPSSGAVGHAVPPPLDLLSPQLTVRALLTGVVLGAVLSVCNVYLGLKIGWGTNMSITGILLAYAAWNGVAAVAGRRLGRFNVLENNINQSACSAAASVSSAGLVAPIPALTMLTGETLSYPLLALWVFCVCLVGITVATGLRRQMIVVDKLPFPSGMACAETLREIYGRGSEAMRRVAMLGAGAVVAAIMKLLEILGALKAASLPVAFGGVPSKSLGFLLDPSLLMVGVGGLIGFRAGASIFLGAILAWAVIGPRIAENGMAPLTARETLQAMPEGVELRGDLARELKVEFLPARHMLEAKGAMSAETRDRLLGMSGDADWSRAVRRLFVASQYRDEAYAEALAKLPPDGAPPAQVEANFNDLLNWLLWPGVTLMVVSSLVSFGFSGGAMIRAFTGISGRGGQEAGAQIGDTGELSRQWFIGGCAFALIAATLCQVLLFEIVWWTAIVGVLLSFVLAIVASRVSGETNITPVGAMGKVTQLVFGVLAPANPAANLMAANVTGGAASQCADLMHDFKCGWLLGASARKQFIGQIAGALAGSIAASAFYIVLIPDPARQLMTDEWPAPAVAAWKAVAELFMVGLSALPQGTVPAMAVAAVVGILLPTMERALPKDIRGVVPSAASLGLAFVVSARYAVSMFIGACIALLLAKLFPRWTTRFLVTICAGIVVGDSLVGAGDAIKTVLAGLGG